MDPIISLNKENIDKEHICCAISDKKCRDSYQLKKEWLKKEFDNGYVFRRIDARAKVFIEYGPAEKGWAPIDASNYLLINCFWVSGKYKGNGYGKKLLQMAIDDAKTQNKEGLVTIVGSKKFHFMSDTKWLLRQGFEVVDTTPAGFSLLALAFNKKAESPQFKPCAQSSTIEHTADITVYFSNRCPFSEYHAHESLKETAKKRGLSLEIIKLDTVAKAQASPTPATIFSLYFKGKFITTDISICMDSRFDKLLKK